MDTQNSLTPRSLAVSVDNAFVCGGDFRNPPTEGEIQAWIVSYLAQLLEVPPGEIDMTLPFDRHGLDSSAAVGLTGDLEDWLGRELDPTLLYDYPTVEALAQHLAEKFQVTA